MRIFPAIGAVLLTSLLLAGTSVAQERQLGSDGDVTLSLPVQYRCDTMAPVTIRAPDPSLFTEDQIRLQRLLGLARAALGFECPNLSSIKITGVVADRQVYSGMALKADNWRLVSGPPVTTSPPANSPASNYSPQQVKRVQYLLSELGYQPGPVDGAFGSHTADAIKRYQADHGLAQTGTPSAELMSQLEASTQTHTAAKQRETSPSSSPKLANSVGSLVAPAPAGAAFKQSEVRSTSEVQIDHAGESGKLDILAKRFGLPIARGIPVVGGGRHNLSQEQQATIAGFLDFVQLGLNSTLLEGDPLCWALNHLPPEQRREYILTGTEALKAGPTSTKSYQKTLVGWRGNNEFERDRIRKSFLEQQGPALREKAVTMPLEVAVVQEYELGDYSREKGGFELSLDDMARDGMTFRKLSSYGASVPRALCAEDFTFHPPAVNLANIWTIAPDEAERVLATLRTTQGARNGVRRKVYIGFFYRFEAMPDAKIVVTGSQPSSPSVPVWSEIVSIGVYQDPDLEQLLYAIPLDQGKQPIVLSGISKRTSAPSVASFNETSLALLLLRDHGDVLDANAWQLLMRQQEEQDKLYYNRQYDSTVSAGRLYSGNRTARYDTDYVPFFPNGFQRTTNGRFSESQIALFKRWAKKRAESMPSEVTLWAELKRDGEAYSPAWSALDSRLHNAFVQALQAKGYSTNQLLRLDVNRSFNDRFDPKFLSDEGLSRQPILVLPNLVRRYLPPATEMQQAGEAGEGVVKTVQFVVSVDNTELVSVGEESQRSGPSEAFVIYGVPNTLRVIDSRSKAILFEKRYEVEALHIGRLETTDLDSVSPPTVDALPLSAEAMDLLTVKYLPDSVSDEGYRQMMMARWEYETSLPLGKGEPDWGRFFIPGRPKPDKAQQAEILARFKEWTNERAAVLPARLRLYSSSVRVQEGQPVPVFVSGIHQLGNMNANSIYSIILSCRTNLHSYPALAPACDYLQNIDENTPAIYPFGLGHGMAGPRLGCRSALGFGQKEVYCDARQAQFEKISSTQFDPGFREILIYDKELFFPGTQSEALSLGGSVGMIVDIGIKGAHIAGEPLPIPFIEARKRYEMFRENLGLSSSGGERINEEALSSRYLIFDAEVHSAHLVDNKTREPIKALELRPARTPDLNALTMPSTELEMPDASVGLDIVNLRLGMSFEQADKLIRDHMEVGRVLTRDRARQSQAVTGNFKQLSSSRIYVAEDGSEFIILYDEPPAAPETVIGITRQINFSQEQMTAAAVLTQLRKKYGQEDWVGSMTNIIGWGEGLRQTTIQDSMTHQCLPGTGNRGARDWTEVDGSSSQWKPMAASLNAVPEMTFYSDMRGRICGPVLAMKFDETNNPSALNRLVFHLIDPNHYIKLYEESRRLVESGKATFGGDISGSDLKL
ncbi:peptidoglycan-binding domain-containing protein [Zobellella sp. An-6]|uniref:peptidoglycan-binding domain-containing protein n=1 Tax=Zobellella sp. An-6 TaxID=3400218 RepID=UPI0040416DBA